MWLHVTTLRPESSGAILPQFDETFPAKIGSILTPAKTKQRLLLPMSDPVTDRSSNSPATRAKTPLWHWAIILGAFLVVFNFASIRDAVSGPIDYDASLAGEVTLYSTTWCGYCAKVRAMFNRHDIPFTERDVEKDAAAAEAFQRLGGRGVPVVTVGNRIVYGYDYARLRNLLECDDCT